MGKNEEYKDLIKEMIEMYKENKKYREMIINE